MTPPTASLGRLLGASLGPGDPGLITRAAWQALTSAACWAWPQTRQGQSFALEIVQRAGLTPPADGLALHFPMTRDATVLARSWATAAEQVCRQLEAGRDVVFLVAGDASTYSTFGHLAKAVRALRPEVDVVTLAGVNSFSAAAALTGEALVDGEEPFAVYSAPEALKHIDALLSRGDALVLLKVRPVLDALLDALAVRDMLGRATFFEKVGTPDERVVHDLASLRGQPVHYLSLVLIRGAAGRGLGSEAAAQPGPGGTALPAANTACIAVTVAGTRRAVALAMDWDTTAAVLIPERFRDLTAGLPDERVRTYAPGQLGEAIGAWFARYRRLVCFAATGVMMRMLAPHLGSKTTDPAVLVVDEAARFVIPLLAGHQGGANALAHELAALWQATPVLTTASDAQGTLAVDLLGRELGWRVEATAEALRHAAACLVNGEPVAMIEEACGREWWPAARPLPANLHCVGDFAAAGEACAYLWVTHQAIDPELKVRLQERLVIYRPPAGQ